MGGQRHALAALPLGKSTGTPCRKRWVGSRVGLESYGEAKKFFCPHRGIERVTVQPVAKSLYLLRHPGSLGRWNPLLKFKTRRTASKITDTLTRIPKPNFVEICWHMYICTNVHWQTIEKKTRLRNRVRRLGRISKTRAAEDRVTVSLDSLVVAHELQSSYTPCGKFSHSMTPSLIYLRLLKEAGKVIPDSPCIHHTYIQEHYLQSAMLQRGSRKW